MISKVESAINLCIIVTGAIPPVKKDKFYGAYSLDIEKLGSRFTEEDHCFATLLTKYSNWYIHLEPKKN